MLLYTIGLLPLDGENHYTFRLTEDTELDVCLYSIMKTTAKNKIKINPLSCLRLLWCLGCGNSLVSKSLVPLQYILENECWEIQMESSARSKGDLTSDMGKTHNNPEGVAQNC